MLTSKSKELQPKLKKSTKNNLFLITMQCGHFLTVKKFTKTHECIEYDTDTSIVKISITEHAQGELRDIVYVGLPDGGTKFSKSDTISCVDSV